MGNTLLLDSFGNIQLYALYKPDKAVNMQEYLKESERLGGEIYMAESTPIKHKHCMDFILVNNGQRALIGSTYTNTAASNSRENFMGMVLNIQFPKEISRGLSEEQKAKITSDIMYVTYFVKYKNQSLDGIRKFYDTYKVALDSRQLKYIKQFLKQEGYEVTYTDIRLILLEYFNATLGLTCDLDCYKKYGFSIRNFITSILEDTSHYKYVKA